MVTGVLYQFDECAVLTYSNITTTIPRGSYQVVVQDTGMVMIAVERRQVNVHAAEWLRIQKAGLARKSPLAGA
jgi:hypothetical protein